jgi:hypothetical protein
MTFALESPSVSVCPFLHLPTLLQFLLLNPHLHIS